MRPCSSHATLFAGAALVNTETGHEGGPEPIPKLLEHRIPGPTIGREFGRCT